MENDGIPPQKPSDKSTVPTWFLTIVSMPIIIGLLWFGRDFLIPLALATLLFILNIALIDRLNSATVFGRVVPRWAAYMLATLGLFISLFALGYVLSNQAVQFAEAGPRYAERVASLQSRFEAVVGPHWATEIENAIRSLDLGSWLTGFAASAAGAIGNIALVLLYVAFMLAERGAFAKKLPRLCATADNARRVEVTLKAISTGVIQYMWINTATSAMSATLAFIVLTALGVDFALPLAIMVFGLNFIPSIGSFLATFFPTVVALLQFESIIPALTIVVVYGGGDAFIGNVVQPKLQGKSLNLSTFVVMVALTFWSIMWGGIGAFIAVPLTVVIMIICSELPGLQPFARLLSSDGILPNEQGAEATDTVQKATQSGDPPSGQAGNDPHASAQYAKYANETEKELALIKEELLERKAARLRKSQKSFRS